MKRLTTGTRASAVAAAGIMVVLALLTVYEVIATKRAQNSLKDVQRASELADSYQAARTGVLQVELTVRTMMVEPGDVDPAVLVPEIDYVMAQTNRIKLIGQDEDRALVQAYYDHYLGALNILKLAVAAHIDFATLQSSLPAESVAPAIRMDFDQMAAERQAQADAALEGYRHDQDTRLFVTSLLNAAGLAMVVFLAFGLRYYSRREARMVAMQAAQSELETARDEADRANAAKSQFLSRMSHELRTPMNAVLGFGQLLEMDDLTETQRENVSFIMRSGRHLLRLIDEVLDISRIEAGRLSLSLEPFDMADVVKDVLDMSAPIAADHGIRVQCCEGEVPQWRVIGDVQRTKQVLLNLVSNAIKYNKPGGTVEIHGEQLPGGEMRLSVRDTGRGISLDSMSRVFSPFDRLGADATTIEGTGLGLALSKALVEAMSGRLEVESVEGQGSTFSVVLPAATAAPAVPAGFAEYRERLAPIGRVVCVEDNAASYHVVEGAMRHLGIDCIRAGTVTDGIDQVFATRPGLVIVDLHLEGGDGAAVLRGLRTHPEMAELPIIVMSADTTERTRRTVLAQGADAFVGKPIDFAQLVETMARVIEPREARQHAA
ncbi:MAG: response regulator [Dehalococcoidia bacterium]|nr:response regulator [Dehalococcoidia bacterium]